MSEQTESLLCIAIPATAIGFFCAGILWGRRHELKWRIRWIAHEYDLARHENRKPRNIDVFDKLCDEEDNARDR